MTYSDYDRNLQRRLRNSGMSNEAAVVLAQQLLATSSGELGELTMAQATATFAAQWHGAAQPKAGRLADVQAIPNLRWLFSPETGFYSDVAGTTQQTADGGAVKCWKDASGHGDHATDATGLTLALGAGNGAAGLNVNGAAARLRTAGAFGSSFDAGFTYFVVAHNPTLATNQVLVSSGDGRWYHNWNGSNQGMGPVFSASSMLAAKIPTDVPTAANTNATKGHVMVEAIRYNGPNTATNYWFDGYQGVDTTNATATALGLTGVLNLGGLASSFPWGGVLHAFVAFNRALTDAEVQVVYNYLSGVCRSQARPLVNCIGNSLTAGTNASRNVMNVPAQSRISTPGYAAFGDTDWPSQLQEMYPQQDVLIRVDAYPGRTNEQIAAELSRTTMALYNPAAHNKRVSIMWEITNDLATNIGTNDAAINAGTEPPAYTNFVNNCKTLTAQGWIVLAATCTPRSDLQNAADNPRFYRAYQYINTLIRNHWSDFAHGLVDIAADPRLGRPGSELDTTYFAADKVHMTDEGYRIVASLVKHELDRWIPSAGPRPVLSKSVAGGANVTLSPAEYATITTAGGQGVVTLTGALTANINVVLPLVNGARALFVNNTTGAFTVTLIGVSGTGYTITQGKKASAYTDGTNWYQASAEL